MNRLAGSTILVTGASSGIGRALAEMLIEQGAMVLGVSRRPATLPAGVAPIEADLTKREDIQEVFQHLGCIDALVNCAGVAYLWGRGPGADRLGQSAAEVGMLFCTIVLISGPLWAKPAWGVWWQEDDPNLRFSIILWTIYAAYLMLRAFGGEEDAVRRFAAVVGIIGALAIPIGMIAVRLRRSIHPVVLARREGGSGLPDPWMRIGLVVSLVALALRRVSIRGSIPFGPSMSAGALVAILVWAA